MKKRYDALDILRFFLASLVIIGHFLTSYKYGTNLDAHISIFDFPFYLKPLGRAVDVFFVLSGFTMAYSTMRPQSSSAFLQKRFARILPLYLIVTIIAIILFSFFPYIDSEGRTYSLDFILNSLIMRPTEQHFPVVTAWTLAYEMLFYVVFAICMSISHKYRVVIATVFLSFSMYFAAVCTYPNFGYLSTLMTPNFFFLEFIAGMWIGLYADKIKIHHGWILCFIGATISYMLIYTDAYASLYRGLYFVLPSALIILGAISIKVPKSNLKLTRKLGDISYTMYITHVFTGFTFPVILRKVFHWDEYSFLLTLIALVMTITISLYVNKFIEKPLYKYLTKTLIELKKPKISRVSIKKYFPVLIILCCLVFDFSMTKALDNRPAWKATRIISNKGSAEEIGNTLAAYDLAIKYGTQYIELDVVTSKTGTLYISHDLSAKNLTGVNKLFGDMTNEEIDQLRINKSSQEKIELLKLQDVITRYTDTINYVIDLKEDTKQVPIIAEIIKKNKLEKKVICQSRKSETVEKLRKVLPKTKNILHVASEEELNQAVTNKNVDTIGLNKSLMTEKNVQLVHQNKKQISIWTLNTTDEIKKAINLNVDSYFTDYTGKAIMLEKEAWKNNNSDK